MVEEMAEQFAKRLDLLRELMRKQQLDTYIIPTDDSHQVNAVDE